MLDMPFNQLWSELGSLISVGGISMRILPGVRDEDLSQFQDKESI